ncbi:MAG TPA: VTT domain-containing protein [Candidatus Paenibacillus intestinavium]|nr:VTT domain-containing protein [Candidatus Paenibacillus intestinavium]
MKFYKWIAILINIAVFILLFLNSDRLIEWIKETNDGNLLVVLLVITLLASIPGIPFGVISGIMGAKYGIVLAIAMSVIASTMSSVLIYIMFRYLLLKQGEIMLNKYQSLARIDRSIKKHTFGTIFIARIVPIMPAIIINIYSGVFGLSFKLFLLATILGKIPIMAFYTFIGDNIISRFS